MPISLSAREILDKLVSFPTVSSVSNLELVDWVEAYLDGYGVKATRVYNDDGTKANLYANVGPEVAGGVILSGHTDVVPVEGQPWDTDPFVVTEKNGKLYGRGTCDMKGFDALALAAVPRALERGVKRPLQIALSYDEEVGCLGAPSMIAEMRKFMPAADAVIVGEPSMMKAVSGHKGGTGIEVHLRGFEVHSSLMHTGVNAIMYAAKLIEWANTKNAENMAKDPSILAANFEPPFTTLHTGVIKGGTAHNITALDCWMGLDFRVVPGEVLEDWAAAFVEKCAQVEADMKAIRPEAGIHLKRRFNVPPLMPEENGAAERLVRQITGDNGSHVVSYGTEAGQFQAEDYSAIICGPGDIAQAHQPNEFLEVSQLEAGEAFMEKLVDQLAS
jgi:acetylornithine deacetylase